MEKRSNKRIITLPMWSLLSKRSTTRDRLIFCFISWVFLFVYHHLKCSVSDFFFLGGSKNALKWISGALFGKVGQIWRNFLFPDPPADLVNYPGFQKAQKYWSKHKETSVRMNPPPWRVCQFGWKRCIWVVKMASKYPLFTASKYPLLLPLTK